MSVRFSFLAVAVIGAVFIVGCAQTSSPTSPSSAVSGASTGMSTGSSSVDLPVSPVDASTVPAVSGKPEYERAYYNGSIVTMNHIEVPQNSGPLAHAAADLYAVIYPANHALWPLPPLCNPCVHNGNPIYHDHVLDSIPSDPGHGEFSPLWHLFVIRPANSLPATQAAYAARLPMTSEAAVDAAVAAGVAVEVDTHSYFLCSIVNANAAK
jgi:hypothetical protein